jgi:hypothetical protein
VEAKGLEHNRTYSITFVNRNSVRDTITRVQDNTSGTTRGIQGQHRLNGDVEGRSVKGFEHDLSHLFTVRLGVQRGFSEQDRVFFRGNSQFIIEGMMPVKENG